MQELAYKTKFRLTVLTGVIYVFSAFLFIRLFYLQMIRGAEYYKQAQENRTQVIRVPAYRSIIYDRSVQNKLAFNRKSLSIIAIPFNIPEDPVERNAVLTNAAELLSMSVEEITNTIRDQAIDKYTPVIIKFDIDSQTLVHFQEHSELYKGFYCENRPRRIYPLREKAAQLIGYTGIISKEEIKKMKAVSEYHSGSVLGKMGIERFYDETIRGKEGIENRIIDVNMNMLDTETIREPVSGNPLVLSIDKDVQELAYDLIGEGTGAVIVSRPATGEILALVSKPSFDPNIFTDRFTMEEFFVLKNNIDKPFLNRAIQGTYPPGSVFKIVTSSAILENNTPITKVINCPGFLKVGNRIFKCWNTGGHGNLSFVSAIANSCDVYFYTMGIAVGKDAILQFAENYGLNKKTEIDIPGETTGSVPDAEMLKKKYDRPWQNGDTANISIGQGDLLVTPIEINVLTMAVANNGLVYKPFVLKQIFSAEDQAILWERKPEILRKVNLSAENFDLIRQGMNGVATYGTGKWLQNYTTIPMAAKSGTVEVGKEKETHAWYTAFAPYGDSNLDDMIAVTVVMEHGGGGSAVAGPVVAKIIDYYFKNKVPYKPSQK